MCPTIVGGGWRLAVGGGWQLATGGWWRLVVVGGGWWLVIGGWWRLAVVGSWRLVAAGGWRRLVVDRSWRLAVDRSWRLAVDRSWWLAVGGPLGRSLRAVLSKKKKVWSLKDSPAHMATGLAEEWSRRIRVVGQPPGMAERGASRSLCRSLPEIHRSIHRHALAQHYRRLMRCSTSFR